MAKFNYKQAKKYAKKLGIKTSTEWQKVNKSDWDKKMPKRPDSYFKNTDEWTGWKDFLGVVKLNKVSKPKPVKVKPVKVKAVKPKKTKTVKPKKSSRVKKSEESVRFVPITEKKMKVYGQPSEVKPVEGEQYLAYDIVENLLSEYNIKTVSDYKTFAKENNLIPNNPVKVYQFKGWKTWDHFLGNVSKEDDSVVNSLRFL